MPKTTISKNTRKEQLPLVAFAKAQAEKLLTGMELANRPETRAASWPQQRASFISGAIMGVDLGYNLATRIAGSQETSDEKQLHTPDDRSEALPREDGARS